VNAAIGNWQLAKPAGSESRNRFIGFMAFQFNWQ
jgi:hypothetical protein